MRSNFESHTILSVCLDNSFVSPAEATRMWELCGEYAETLYGALLSKIPYGKGYSVRYDLFIKAMKQMNEVREYNYKKANGLIEPWDCDAEGDPEDE